MPSEMATDFMGLDFESRRKLLSEQNTDFSGLDAKEQDKILQSLRHEDIDKIFSGSVAAPIETKEETIQQSDLTKRNILEGVRGITEAGGMLAGGALGGIPGAGLGYAAGRKIADITEEIAGIRKPPPIGTQMIETGRDVLAGATMEAGGQLAGKAVGGAIESVTNIFSQKAESLKALRLKRLAEKYDIDLTASDILQSKPLALFESLSEKGLLTSGMLQEERVKSLQQLIATKARLQKSGAYQEDISTVGQMIKDEVDNFIQDSKLTKDLKLEQIRNDILNKLGSKETFEDLGKEALENLAGKSQEVLAKSQKAYMDVGEAIPPKSIVPYRTLEKTAQSIYNRLTKAPPSAQNKELLRVIADYLPEEKTLPLIGGQDPEVIRATNPQLYEQIKSQIPSEAGKDYSWEGLQIAHGKFRDLIQSADEAYKLNNPGVKGMGSVEGAFYKQMDKALVEDMEAFAKKQGGDAWDKWQLAKSMYREFKTTYDNDIIRRILKTNPELIVDKITRPNHTTEIDFVKKAIGQDQFDQTLKPGITNRLLNIGKDEVLNPQAVTKNLNKMGDEALLKIYTPQELNQLKLNIAQGLDLSKEPLAPTFLKTISSSHPETIVNQIILNPTAKYTVRNVDLIKQHTSPQTFEQLKGIFTDKLFESEPKTGFMSPVKFASKINNYEQVLPKFYNASDIQVLKELSEIANNMQSAERLAGNPSGTGQIIIAGSQLGLIVHGAYGLVTGDYKRAAETSAVVLLPMGLTKLYLSQAGKKFLLAGARTFGGTRKATEIATKLIAIAGRENTMPIDQAIQQYEQGKTEGQQGKTEGPGTEMTSTGAQITQ